MRLIDADALKEELWDDESIERVDAAPTVRCEECKNRYAKKRYGRYLCKHEAGYRLPDFGCSYFERKDDD